MQHFSRNLKALQNPFSRRFQPPLLLATILLLLAAFASSAHAVVEVKFPLSKEYHDADKGVLSATISKLNPDNQVIEAKIATLYKGDAPPNNIVKIKIQAPPELFEQLNAAKDHSVGTSLVILAETRSTLIHLADHWYTAVSPRTFGAFVIDGRKTDHDGTFPGTTPTLLQALDELKAGKSTLVDTFPPITLPRPQKVGDLPPHATSFQASENPGDKSIDFIINDVQRFTFNGKSLAGPTLLGNNKHPGPMPQTKEKIIAQTATSPTDDAKPDSLIVVTPNGLLRYSLVNPIALPEDDLRLTGSKLTSYYEAANKNGFTAASIISLDLNHDNRPDLILLTPEGTLTLLNRGFGCYLVNKNMAAPLLDPANPKALPLLASTGSTLWLLRPDGGLYRYDFPAK